MTHPSLETIVFGAMSVISLPGGVGACWLGFHGEFIDASYRENVCGGFAFLVIGLVPPVLTFASWVCDKPRPDQKDFDVARHCDSGKAG
ncbi:MAG TPA: hypothetical protein VF595_05115 [Tepidisphaeraceae bacterium]|jgi:hypothetical protein